MPEIIPVKPADLDVDNENPRIADEGLGQREALRAVAGEDDGRFLLALAEDIVTYGQLSPAELPIVYKSPRKKGKYIVGEGNRRLTAIRALENPDTFAGAVSGDVLDQLRKLSAKYQAAPIEEIQCCLMKDAKEADHWIDLRHTGKNGGAGLVEWGPHEKARRLFRRTGKLRPHVALLDFLENGGHISSAERRRIPLSSFERLVKSPAVRQRIGIGSSKDGKPQFQNENVAVAGLLYIARDLMSGQKSVIDIYTKDQRTEYAKKIPTQAVPLPIPTAAGATPGPTVATAVQRAPLLRASKERDKLIPHDCRLRVLDPRIRRMGVELQGLSLREYANANAVLFRVFLELSADYYLVHTMKKLKSYLTTPGVTLSKKLLEVVEHLESNGKLSRQDASPVKAACQKKSFLATSVTTMNEYIHNYLMIPTPTDLRAAWDGFEPFIKALWP